MSQREQLLDAALRRAMASGKFWPCFKKFLEQRRINKKEES